MRLLLGQIQIPPRQMRFWRREVVVACREWEGEKEGMLLLVELHVG